MIPIINKDKKKTFSKFVWLVKTKVNFVNKKIKIFYRIWIIMYFKLKDTNHSVF